MMAGQSYDAEVASQDGWTFSWTLSGGTFVTPNLSDYVTFTVGAPGTVVLSCTGTRSADGRHSTDTVRAPVHGSPKVLIDLGHGANILKLRREGQRLLIADGDFHWVLWDFGTATQVAQGDYALLTQGANSAFGSVEMAGPALVVEWPDAFDVRSSTDGNSVSEITFPHAWWKLASDGSYLCAGSSTGLRAWSTAGALLASRAGNYADANVFAAPGEVRVAKGPAGLQVLEILSTTDGTARISPAYTGDFGSWFVDGGKFLAISNGIIQVYSSSGVLLDQGAQAATGIAALGQVLTGQDGHYWSRDDIALTIYKVGGGGIPELTFVDAPFLKGNLWPSGTFLGITSGSTAKVIDLAGALPVLTERTLPFDNPTGFVAKSSTEWLVGGGSGLVHDIAKLSQSPRWFGLGAVTAMAGCPSRLVVSVASGTTFVFKPSSLVPESTLPGAFDQLAISTDGTVLLAQKGIAGTSTSQEARALTLPALDLIHSWTYGETGPHLQWTTLSSSGNAVGQHLVDVPTSPTGHLRMATAVAGGSPYWSDTDGSGLPIFLSPDGTSVAAVTAGEGTTRTWTTPYKGGLPGLAQPVKAGGWVDGSRWLGNTWTSHHALWYLDTCYTFEPAGQKMPAPSLPPVTGFQTLGPDVIYSSYPSAVLDLTTGRTTWASGIPRNPGTVFGQGVATVHGGKVLVEPF